MTGQGPLLTVRGLSVDYGAVRAVRGITLGVERGEVVALLGANGAGKSTTLNAIMGLVQASAGEVRFDGRDVTRVPTELRVRAGMTLTPERRRIFPDLTVEENLRLGGAAVRDRAASRARLHELLDLLPVLRERRHQLGGTLSGGEQQQLAIARSLMSGPALLLLDEPSLGLAPVLVEQVYELIDRLHEGGTAMLLVEQDIELGLRHADRAYVLASGELVADGDAASLRASDTLERVYLGLGAE